MAWSPTFCITQQICGTHMLEFLTGSDMQYNNGILISPHDIYLLAIDNDIVRTSTKTFAVDPLIVIRIGVTIFRIINIGSGTIITLIKAAVVEDKHTISFKETCRGSVI